MSLTWPKGDESGKEATFNGERANKWTNSIIPSQDMVIHLSGVGSQRTTELTDKNLYVLISKVDMHIVAGTGSVTATTSSLFWPALIPNYFIPQKGKQYIAVISSVVGSSVDAYVSIIEDTEG